MCGLCVSGITDCLQAVLVRHLYPLGADETRSTESVVKNLWRHRTGGQSRLRL
jgi:hypothetical protein